MATNEILRFAETDTGTNLLTQAEYAADSQRPIGNQPGVARSKLVNKALRQSSLIAAGIAEFLADNQSNNITDSLTPQNIADYMAVVVRSLGIPTAVAGGTADAITADFTPNVALTNGTTVIVRAGAANTTATPTFAPDGLTAKTIVKGNNLPLVAGDIAGAGHWLEMNFDPALDKWVLQNPATGVQAQGKFANVQQFNASTTLTVGQLGSIITFFGTTAGQTITLPPVASVVGGNAYWIQNTSSQPVTIKANGAEVIGFMTPGVGYNAANTIVLAPGDSTCLYSSQTQWFEHQGVRAAAFGASSLSANGYQKLPSGLIIQWGLVTTNGSGVGAVTFPIAFPSACYSVNVTADVAVSQFANISGAISLTGFTANSYTSNTGAAAASLSVYWIAIGK